MDSNCVFCRIVAGQIPALKVYETDAVVAFLDINPIEKGHTLVISKAHHATLMDTPDRVLAQTAVGVRRVAAGLMKACAHGVNVLQSNHACAGQEVPHLHFHVVPRQNTGRSRSWVSGNGKYDTDEERDRFAERIRTAIAATAAEIPNP
jgi:histidine triad (HIT) family protein